MWEFLTSIWHDSVWSKVIAAGILTAIGLVWAAIKFHWGRSKRVTITRPDNNKALSTEWVRVEGKHLGVDNGQYHYWLMTTHGSEWWPAEDLKLNVNGKWDSRINVGKKPGPRLSSAAIVRVTPAIHALLVELRRLRTKTKDYAGIRIPYGYRREWLVVDQVDVQIPDGAVRINETS